MLKKRSGGTSILKKIFVKPKHGICTILYGNTGCFLGGIDPLRIISLRSLSQKCTYNLRKVLKKVSFRRLYVSFLQSKYTTGVSLNRPYQAERRATLLAVHLMFCM